MFGSMPTGGPKEGRGGGLCAEQPFLHHAAPESAACRSCVAFMVRRPLDIPASLDISTAPPSRSVHAGASKRECFPPDDRSVQAASLPQDHDGTSPLPPPRGVGAITKRPTFQADTQSARWKSELYCTVPY